MCVAGRVGRLPREGGGYLQEEVCVCRWITGVRCRPVGASLLRKGLGSDDALLSPTKFHLSTVVQADPRSQVRWVQIGPHFDCRVAA